MKPCRANLRCRGVYRQPGNEFAGWLECRPLAEWISAAGAATHDDVGRLVLLY